MEIAFDISEDELPIFLAEVDEHLQALDDILIRLERNDSDPELVQTVFRSAHTIKGMCGMIGHRRMTDLTHALESALDGVRKNTIQISPRLVNLCLEAVDRLRFLRDEVDTNLVSDIDIDEIMLALKGFSDEKKECLPSIGQFPEQNAETQTDTTGLVNTPELAGKSMQIRAKIDTNSLASAARAFQLMMVLQDAGDIQLMTPTQAQIETATSISDFTAVLVTSQPFEKVSSALSKISGVDEISIDGVIILSNGLTVTEQLPKAEHQEPAESSSAPSTLPTISDTNSALGERRTNPFGRRASDMTVRTNVERLNNLMNLVGELITDRNHLKQIHGQLTRLNSNYDRISSTLAHLGGITDQIQEEVMRIRMLPVSSVLGKFPRMVHDMSRKVDKLIDVVIRGEETEMDRSMIEEINDPLIHLVRNAVDHGLELPHERLAAGKPERGTITLTARHEQGRIILTVEDDGKGIDGERLRKSALQKGLISAEEAASLTEDQSVDLMFLPGLSTAEKVTDISGRGVGLDIVASNVQRVSGSIQVETQPGKGTRFQIVLPLTLAIVPALLVKVNQTTLAIPLVMITETLRLEPTSIQHVYQKPVTLLRGNVLSLLQLSKVFDMSDGGEPRKNQFAVVVQTGKQRVGLVVDSLVGEDDVIVKPLGAFIGDILGISSAAILGDGEVALIVDIFGLFKLAGI